MLTITIRTDKPESEVGLYEDATQLKYEVWLAHRELAETIHKKIDQLLQSEQKKLGDLEGIVIFKGPGSFTGLRIGVTVANALASSLGIPIVSASGKNWVQEGIKKLQLAENEQIVLPEYGSAPNITQPKH